LRTLRVNTSAALERVKLHMKAVLEELKTATAHTTNSGPEFTRHAGLMKERDEGDRPTTPGNSKESVDVNFT
jgi:hypothetical protein